MGGIKLKVLNYFKTLKRQRNLLSSDLVSWDQSVVVGYLMSCHFQSQSFLLVALGLNCCQILIDHYSCDTSDIRVCILGL